MQPNNKPNNPTPSQKPAQGQPPANGQNRPNRPGSNNKGRQSGNRRSDRRNGGQRLKPLPTLMDVPTNKTVYAPRKANQPTKDTKVRIIPLGGVGEIGKNTMAIEYGNDIIVIDLGFKFPDEQQPGVDYVIADIGYLEKNKHKIRGLVITHAHEDHVGAIPFSWPKLSVPIYGSRFSLAYIEKKLVEYQLQVPPKLIHIDPDQHQKVQLGVFKVELVRVTHAIPDPCAVVIDTPAGRIIHTGDWRIDPNPVDGKLTDLTRLKEVGQQGVALLMSDSTGCEILGRTPSESEIEPNILNVIQRQKGRVIISAFSSQINRAQSIVNAVHKSGRKLAITGRSMLANIELAFKLGYIKVPPGLLVKIQDTVRMPDDQVAIYCTGSQGELNAILWRMSTGDHPHIKLKNTDSIIFSSSIIPGNEKKLVTLMDQLMREGAHVFHNVTRQLDDCGLLHVSGHAYRDELVEMIQMTKPKYFMPIHGEFHHLVRHAELAEKSGIPRQNIVIADIGDVVELTANSISKGERVPSGAVMVDAGRVGDVEAMTLRDRVAMSEEGIFVIVATVERRTGKLLGSPDILSRGFVYMKENEELIQAARGEVRKFFETRDTSRPLDMSAFKMDLRDRIGDFLYLRFKRSPIVISVINEV